MTFDLRNFFTVPGVTGQVAQFDTVLGKFNVELLAGRKADTVTVQSCCRCTPYILGWLDD